MLPKPYGYAVREMGLCNLSGKNRQVFAYETSSPCYEKLSDVTKKDVEKACEQHGVPYEPKYTARAKTCLTNDFDEFVTKYASKPNVGVWAGDAVAQAFMEGLGVTTVVIEHADLQTLPLGSVLRMNEQHHNPACSRHWLRKCIDDDDSYMHRCSIEFVCALAALVRKQTKYRSPTILEDLLYQKNLWQYRMERFLDVMMCCSECSAEMSRAFDRGEGLSWYPDCDTSTLDTLAVLTPPIEPED